jgi:hypothetical protein
MEADSAMRKIIEDRWGEGKKKALTDPAKSDENTLTLQIANQEPSYDAVADKYYVKFDVLASSNNPNIYFDGVDLRIGYNSALFGSNIIANGKLSVSVGSYFDILDGYVFFAMNDRYSNGVRIIYSADLGYSNRVPLDSVPRPLLHFKIEVLPNPTSNRSSIAFLDTASTAANSSYTLSSDADFFDYIAYDQLFFIHSDTITVVTDGSPVITTDLGAISMIAGVGDTLAIRGYHFGNVRGSVYFTAADRGGIVPNTMETDFLKGLDIQYYGPWSDTLIKVIVPSRVYQGYANDIPNSSGGAGTGPVKIRTATGDSCLSATSLHIPYSVANVKVGTSTISRVHLARKNCDYDFQFTLHEHYNNPIHTNKIAAMDSALRYWSTLTGLTLVLERDVSGNLVFETTVRRDKNMICESRSLANGAMSVEFMYALALFNGDYVPYSTVGTHISMRDNPTATTSWSYAFSGSTPPGGVSFYQSFMHEVGHILLLDHVNDDSELMYYGVRSASPIVTINSSSTCVDVVEQNITASRAFPWPLYSPDNSFYPVGVKNPRISILSHAAPALLYVGDVMTLSSNHATGNSWSTGATTPTIRISAAGTYTLFVSEAPWCAHSTSIAIAASPLTASFAVGSVRCRGASTGSIVARVTGGTPPYTYRWAGNGITPQTTANIHDLAAGRYSLTLSDNGGSRVNYTVSVSEPKLLEVHFRLPDGLNGVILASPRGGTPPYTYQWYYKAAGPRSCPRIPNSTSSSIPASYADNRYCMLTLRVTDACGEEHETQLVPFPPFIPFKSKSDSIESDVVVFPNPTSGLFTISNLTEATAHLYSSVSGYIQSFEHLSGDASIDIGHLASGVYILKIVDGGQVWHEKIVLQK